jgi:hypothetical protein
VISAKFGSLRVKSVRVENRAVPVPVFNLTVARSHAYWVGSADVLVHNTGCGHSEDSLTVKERLIEQKENQLKELKARKKDRASSSSEQPHERQQRIKALKEEISLLKKQAREIKYYRIKKEKGEKKPQPSRARKNNQNVDEPTQQAGKKRAPPGQAVELNQQKVDELTQKIKVLQSTTPTSTDHARKIRDEIDELRAELRTFSDRLKASKYQKKAKTTPELITRRPRQTLRGEDLKKALADAKAELQALRRNRTDPAAAPGARESELERTVRDLTYDVEKDDELADLKNQLAKLKEGAGTSRDPNPNFEQEKLRLEGLIRANMTSGRTRAWARKMRKDPVAAAQRAQYVRDLRKRQMRSPDYVNDPNRPPDTIDLLERELAELEAQPSSPSRDWSIKYVKKRLEIEERKVELRRELILVHDQRGNLLTNRRRLVEQNRDTTEIDAKLAALDEVNRNLMQQLAQARARDILDGIDDEPQATPGSGDDAQLDQEIMDHVLGEIENEQAARQQELQQDTREVDEETRLINDLLASMPSPGPNDEVQAGVSPGPADELRAAVNRFASDLKRERTQFQNTHFSLTNEYAYVSVTLGSDGGARRLDEIRAEITELGVTWKKNTQQRLDETRSMLRALQSTATLRHETMEAELAEQITLLEGELANPPF